MPSIETERNLETLRKMARMLESENQRLTQRTIELERALLQAQGISPDGIQLRLLELEETLAQRNRALFSPSSERRPRDEAGTEPKPAQPGHGPTAQPNLPTMDVTHTLDDADKTCPSCGGELTEWEGQAEESEEIDVVERQFVIRKHRRLKYRCKCHACVETAIGPAKLIAGGRYSPAFAVEVACQKYCDHLPLERQARIMEREGLTVTSQTLWDQLDALAAHLQPIHERIRDNVLASPVLHADETRWRLLNGRGEDGGDAPWHVWAIATPSAISYRILDGRSKLQAGRILGNYRGTIVADGYGVYQSLSRDGPGFRLAGCWAHARRKYVEAAENYPQPSNAMLELIGQLYDVERDAADAAEQGTRDLAEIRAELRTQRSRTLIDAIFALAEKTYSAVLPKSAIGKATAYLLNQRKPLCVFLDDGRVPIDNNAVERGLRGPVIGRKNHYGSKSRRGMEVAALFYSLIETCKLAGVEPKAYLLRAVTAALANEPAPLPGEASPAN